MLALLVDSGSQRMLALLVGSVFFPVPPFLRGVRGDLNLLLQGGYIKFGESLTKSAIVLNLSPSFPSFLSLDYS